MLKFREWPCLSSGRMFKQKTPKRLLFLGRQQEPQATTSCSRQKKPVLPIQLRPSRVRAQASVLQQTQLWPKAKSWECQLHPRHPNEVGMHNTHTHKSVCAGVRGGKPTLRQTCPWPKPRAQYAFKDSMIHGILQFTLRIAFRCVLHRCESQDIRC